MFNVLGLGVEVMPVCVAASLFYIYIEAYGFFSPFVSLFFSLRCVV